MNWIIIIQCLRYKWLNILIRKMCAFQLYTRFHPCLNGSALTSRSKDS